VILALQINGVRTDYVCTFIVNNVDVTEKEQQPEKILTTEEVEEVAEEVHFDHYLISR